MKNPVSAQTRASDEMGTGGVCKLCGAPLPNHQVAMMSDVRLLENTEYNQWYKKGYCSLSCFEKKRSASASVAGAANSELLTSPKASITPPEFARSGYQPALTISFWRTLFSFRGRISRSTYWVVSLLSNAAVFGLSSLLPGGVPLLTKCVEVAVFGVVLWIGFSITARRWHDLGFPVRLILGVYIVFVGIATALVWVVAISTERPQDWLVDLFLAFQLPPARLTAFLVGTIILIFTWFVRGDSEPNRYGPVPLTALELFRSLTQKSKR